MVRFHLSDGSSFALHAEVVAREKIAVGISLDSERLSQLLTLSEQVLARVRALALLSRSAHTRRGLSRKLAARGFSAEAIRHAATRMKELGYLDDRSFAEEWVRLRLSTPREGVKSLSRGLLGRGVPRALAEEVVAALCPPEVELEAARRVAAGLSPAAAARRLTGRGFRSRTIGVIVRELERKARGPAEE